MKNSLQTNEKNKRKRKAANERERNRMMQMNIAFENLREKIQVQGKRLSKFETLQMARSYIIILQNILKQEPK